MLLRALRVGFEHYGSEDGLYGSTKRLAPISTVASFYKAAWALRSPARSCPKEIFNEPSPSCTSTHYPCVGI